MLTYPRGVMDPSVPSPADGAERRDWARLALARTLAARLISYRAEHGLPLEELADRLGLHPDELVQIESGQSAPSFELLCRVSSVLGLQIEVSIAPAGMKRLGFYPEDWVSSPVPVMGGAEAEVHVRILAAVPVVWREPWSGWCEGVEGRRHDYQHVAGTDSIDRCSVCEDEIGK